MVSPSTIFVFSGRDQHRRSAKLSKWMEVFIAKYGDAGLSRISANGASSQSICSEIQALPFLVEKRLVVLDDTLVEKWEKPNEEKKKLLSAIADCLDNTPDSTFVVFTASAPDETNELYKKLAKIAKIETIEPLRGQALYIALMEEFPTLGTKNARTFVERCEGEEIDSWVYIEKLRLFSDASLRNENIVEEILPKTEEYSAFALSDSVLGFQTKRAFSLFETMIKTRDIRGEIFSPLVEWLRTGLYIAKARKSGLSDAEIAKKLGVHPYVLTKRAKWKNTQYATILEVFSSLVQTEVEGKTGELPGIDDDERLIFGISRALFCLEKTQSAIQSY